MISFSQNLLGKVQRLPDLPVLSPIRLRGLDLLKSSKATRHDFSQLLKYDQILSAKILRLVNSASYGLQKNISNVETALSFMGDHSLQLLFLGSSDFLASDLAAPFGLADYWLHNYMVAFAAGALAEIGNELNPAEVFSCGLLHDLGKLALWKSDPALFVKILDKQKIEGCSFFAAESFLQIPGHHVIGEAVARAWGLPYDVRQTMRFHHRDVTQMQSLEESVQKKIACVILANHMVKTLRLGCAWGKIENHLLAPAMRLLNINASQTILVEKALSQELNEITWVWAQAFCESPSKNIKKTA